jgi:hypothetical protein
MGRQRDTGDRGQARHHQPDTYTGKQLSGKVIGEVVGYRADGAQPDPDPDRVGRRAGGGNHADADFTDQPPGHRQ